MSERIKDNINTFEKGLNKESGVPGRDQQAVNFALNATVLGHEGNAYRYQTESGNEECYELPKNYKVVGRIYMSKNEQVVFSTDNINSEIGIVTGCKYQSIINNSCLNFSTQHPITGEFRVVKGCDRKIYWRDSFNPDRHLNIDDWLREKDCQDFDCDQIEFNPKVTEPTIDLVSVNNSGGSIPLGVLFFQVEILDEDQNLVYRGDLSRPVSIYDENTTDLYENIDGGLNIDTYPDEGVPLTNKSVTLRFGNLDTSFAYLRLNVRPYAAGDGQTSTAHSVGNLISITGETVEYTYTGFDVNNGDFPIDTVQTITPKTVIDRSASFEQVQNRLLRANVSEPNFNPSELQRAASKIYTEWITEDYSSNDQEASGNAKNPKTYWLDTSFMDDEIVALGIGFELDNGYKTPIFHIPGIHKNRIIVDDDCMNPDEYNEEIVGNSQEQCLEVTITAPCPPPVNCDGDIEVEATVTYEVDGEEYETVESIQFNMDSCQSDLFDLEYTFTAGCYPINATISNVQINTVIVDAALGCEGISVFSDYEILINSNDIQTFEGDDVIIQEWTPDLIPFTDLTEEEYNALDDEDKFEYWEIYNTALRIGEDFGRMGYHQCNTAVYEAPQSCCIDEYWGTDYCGYPLEGQPIRHHRLPCRSLIGVHKATRDNVKLGIRFHNVTYPDSRIVSHFFVMGKRTEGNKTVLDQGIAGNLGKNEEYTAFSFFDPNTGNQSPGNGFPDCISSLDHDDEHLWYFTPRTHYNNEYLNAAYLKVVRVWGTQNVRSEVFEVDDIEPAATNATDVFMGARIKCYRDNIAKSDTIYYPIYDNKIINPYAQTNDGSFKFVNMSRSNKVGLIRSLNIPELNRNSVWHISLKTIKDVYCNLDSIDYVRIHQNNFTLQDSYDVYGGDTVVSRFDVWNHFLWKVNQNYMQFIALTLGLVIVAVAGIFTGGAALTVIPGISSLLLGTIVAYAALFGAGVATWKGIESFNANFNKGLYNDFICDSYMNEALDNIDEDLQDYVATMSEYLRGIHLASEVNCELRHSGFRDCDYYYQNVNESICGDDASDEDLYFHLKDKLIYYDEENEQFRVKDVFCPEFYNYNKDYSKYHSDKLYFPIPKTFDFCTNCLGLYKNTIVYSEKSFDTEQIDKYLSFLIDNARDVSAHRGAITGMKFRNNRLYVHTEESTFILLPNPQQIQTDADVAYLGTGDFLALPPQEIIESDTGFGGSQTTLGYSDSEFGHLWIDQSKGDVHLLSNQLEEISRISTDTWFKENLPSVLNTQFKEALGEEYPLKDAITDEWGIGIISVYDPKHNRIIIHKRDFKALYPIRENVLEGGRESLVWADGKFYRSIPDPNSLAEVKLTDPKYFQNKSWTISYSLDQKFWVSLHSYQPYFFLNDRTHLYTADGNKVYRHLHNGNYSQFYGIKFPFILEGVQNTIQTSDLHSFIYVCNSERFNNVKETFESLPNVTFNKAYFYNSNETSGLLDIQYLDLHNNPYGNILLPEGVKTVIRTDENYKIAGIRDVSVAAPVISKDWLDIQQYFNVNGSEHGYMDIVTINFDHNKDPYLLKQLNDKYLIYRLIYEPQDDDVRLTFIASQNRMFLSIR